MGKRLLTLARIQEMFQNAQQLDSQHRLSKEPISDRFIHICPADDVVPTDTRRIIKEPRSEEDLVANNYVERVTVQIPFAGPDEDAVDQVFTAFVSTSHEGSSEPTHYLLTINGSVPYTSAEDLVPVLDLATNLESWELAADLAYDAAIDFDATADAEEERWLDTIQYLIDTYDQRVVRPEGASDSAPISE